MPYKHLTQCPKLQKPFRSQLTVAYFLHAMLRDSPLTPVSSLVLNIMVASIVLRASLLLVGLLAPSTLATPIATGTIAKTPFGERDIANVHLVPRGSFYDRIARI